MSNRFYAGASAGERFAGYANLAMNLYQLKQNADENDLKEKELAMRERFKTQENEETARVNDLRYGKGGLKDREIEASKNTNEINKRKNEIEAVKLPQSKQNFSRSVVAMEVAKMKSAGLDKAYKPTIDYLTELADDPNVTKGEAYLRIKTSYPHFRKVMIDNLQKELVSGTESNPDFMNTPRGQNLIGEIEALDQDPDGKYIDTLFPDVVEERAMEERKMKLEEQKAQPKDKMATVVGYDDQGRLAVETVDASSPGVARLGTVKTKTDPNQAKNKTATVIGYDDQGKLVAETVDTSSPGVAKLTKVITKTAPKANNGFTPQQIETNKRSWFSALQKLESGESDLQAIAQILGSVSGGEKVAAAAKAGNKDQMKKTISSNFQKWQQMDAENQLKGKKPYVYMVDGFEVEWDGNKIIKMETPK